MKSFLSFIFLIFLPVFSEESDSRQNGSDIHGLVDFVVKNDYITPRGLLVTDTDVTIQILAELSLDFYKNPNCFLNKVSLVFGVWNDLWTGQNNCHVGAWNEMDWYAGFDFAFVNNWRLRAQFIEFLSPPGNFRPEDNAEFILSYDDSFCQFPIVFHPYVRLFWAICGDSTVVVGRPGKTYYVEFGLFPTYIFDCGCFPLAVTAPTWLSVGPRSFWNGGKCALKNENSRFGLFSTGLTGSVSLPFVRSSLGKWSAYVGFQYYYLINRNLLQAQIFTLNLSSIHSAKRNVCVGFAGVRFEF